MANRKALKTQPPAAKSQALVVSLTPEERIKGKAVLETHPPSNAAGIIQLFGIHKGETDYLALCTAIDGRCKAMQETGGIKRAEEMLIAQAYALDSMFASLARRAKNQETLAPLEAFMKLALKAQSQCRATLETLATIKNPPVVFAKQANIAHGPQQVNNGVASEPSHAEKKAIEPTELLEQDHGKQWLDAGTATKTSSGNPVLVPVEEVHRAQKQGRKGDGKP